MYACAMWLSPRFHLDVIRASVRHPPARIADDAHDLLPADQTDGDPRDGGQHSQRRLQARHRDDRAQQGLPIRAGVLLRGKSGHPRRCWTCQAFE